MREHFKKSLGIIFVVTQKEKTPHSFLQVLSWLVPARSYLECSSYSGNQIYKIFQHLQKTKDISAPSGKQHGSTTSNQPVENGFFRASDVSTKIQNVSQLK